ncbi:MAG TPA: DUF2069 domain-containing protein [Paenalcaligenes sp.]|nr:DUF2069 domain-containing protein [Paenalcaligenes sp.]
MQVRLSKPLHYGAIFCLIGLIVLGLGWELRWAPIRPGGSYLALKVVPLLFAVRGVLRGSLYTMQWACMLVLLYFMEGVVRVWSDPAAASVYCAWVEIALSLGFYLCAIFYVFPAKREARKEKKAKQLKKAQQGEMPQPSTEAEATAPAKDQ